MTSTMGSSDGASRDDSLVVDGVRLFPDRAQKNVFWYVPLEPLPEVNDDGVPSTSLIMLGTTSILNVGATLTVDDSTLAGAQAVAQQHAADPARPVDLRPAPFMVTSVTLWTTGADGEERVLGTSTSSGYSPFNAVFSASLDEPTTAAAASALRGGSGHLFVTYVADVTLPTGVGPGGPPGDPSPTAPTPGPGEPTPPPHAGARPPVPASMAFVADVASWFADRKHPNLIVAPGRPFEAGTTTPDPEH